jgi:hypothetical protein
MDRNVRQETGKIFRHRLHDGLTPAEKEAKPFAKSYKSFIKEEGLTFLCDHFQINVFGIAHQVGVQGKGRDKEEFDNYRCFYYLAKPEKRHAPYFLIFNYSNNEANGADHYVAMRHNGKFLVDAAQVERWKEQIAATPLPQNIMPFVVRRFERQRAVTNESNTPLFRYEVPVDQRIGNFIGFKINTRFGCPRSRDDGPHQTMKRGGGLSLEVTCAWSVKVPSECFIAQQSLKLVKFTP